MTASIIITRACQGSMHSNCLQQECGCYCHQQCPDCGKPCQVTYDLSKHLGGEPHEVCHRCYREQTANVKQRHCEGDDCETDSACCGEA